MPATAEAGTSLFASRSQDKRRIVAIALNLEPDTAREARVKLKGCGALKGARLFTYAGEPRGFAEQPTSSMGARGAGREAAALVHHGTGFDAGASKGRGQPPLGTGPAARRSLSRRNQLSK